MTSFLIELLKMSIMGSLTWLGLSLLKLLTQRVFSQAWHYYIGLIPTLFLFGASRAAAAIIDAVVGLLHDTTTANTPLMELPSALLAESMPTSGMAQPMFLYDFVSGVVEKASDVMAKMHVSTELFVTLVMAVWLIGFVVFLSRKIIVYVRFHRNVSRSGMQFSSAECKLPVIVCTGVTTPMLVGVFKPVIVLPDRDYNEQELTFIFEHETAHWRRGDILIKLLLLIVNALHWFNPLAYQMNKEMARLCENACDESVARHMNKSERVLYGELILSSMTHDNATALCAGMSMGKKLKRRLLYMLTCKKTKKAVVVLSLLVACATAIGGMCLAGSIDGVMATAATATAEDNEILPDEIISEAVKLPEHEPSLADRTIDDNELIDPEAEDACAVPNAVEERENVRLPYYTRDQMLQLYNSGLPQYYTGTRQKHIQPELPPDEPGGVCQPNIDCCPCDNTYYLLIDGQRVCSSCGYIFTEEQDREIGEEL